MAIPDFTGPELDALARAVAKALSDSREPRTNWERLITIIVGVIAIVSLVFSFGINWSKVDSNARETASLRVDLKAAQDTIAILRQEMNSGSMTVQSQLGDIKAQLGEIRGALGGSPSPLPVRGRSRPVFPSSPSGIQ